MTNKKESGALDMKETLSNSEAFYNKNKKAILIVLSAIIILIAGLLIYKAYYAGPREEKASTALAKGQEYFNMEQFDKALNGDSTGYTGFIRIISDYSGTDAANLANLYAGLSCANLNKWNDAVKYLEAYSPSDDAMVSPAAVAALGNAYAQIGEVDKAVKNLKDAAKMADSRSEEKANMSISPTFLIQAGELLESQGKKSDALKIYKDIKTKYVNSPVVQNSEIDKYIERVSE